jgi:hypothetical protein
MGKLNSEMDKAVHPPDDWDEVRKAQYIWALKVPVLESFGKSQDPQDIIYLDSLIPSL